MLPQFLRSWYVWLFQIPWLPEMVWRHLQGFARGSARRIDPTIELLPWGKEVRHNAERTIDLYRANVIPRLREPLPWRTSVPVLLVIALRDGWVSPRSVAGLEARCRDLTRVEIDAGHWLPRAEPQEFARVVTEFVRAHP